MYCPQDLRNCALHRGSTASFPRGDKSEGMHNEACFSFCTYIVLLNLQNWEELPWYLCIQAHHDQATAREGGKRILIKFDKLPEEALHRRLTVQLCALGSPLRRQLQRFIRGENSPPYLNLEQQ